jgi:hypothetical protein
MLTRPAPSYLEMVEAVKNDPRMRLRMALHRLEETDNPFFAWQAIDLCIKSKMPFPAPVVQYLGLVAKSILSDEASKMPDLGRALPMILGFNVKRGRGHMLKPANHPRHALLLRTKFAMRIEHGDKPVAALRNAADEIFDDPPDDKTLKKWICKEFEQKTWLRTNAEWKTVARAHYWEEFQQFQNLYREVAP